MTLKPIEKINAARQRAQRSFRLGLERDSFWNRSRLSAKQWGNKISESSTMTPRFGVLVAVVIAGVLLFPLLIESASGSCHAVEKRFINTLRKYGNQQDIGATLFLDMFSEATRGEVAARLVKTEYPNLPPFVGCSIIYYKAFFDDREMLKYRNLIQ